MNNDNCGSLAGILRFFILLPLLLLLHGCLGTDSPVIMEQEKSGASNALDGKVPDISGDYIMVNLTGSRKPKTIIRDEKSANAFMIGDPGMKFKPVLGGIAKTGPSRMLVEKLSGQNHILIQQEGVRQGNEKSGDHILMPAELVPEGLRIYIVADPDSKDRTWNTAMWERTLAKHGLTTDKDIRKLVRGQLSEKDYAAKVKAAIDEMLEAKALGSGYVMLLRKAKPDQSEAVPEAGSPAQDPSSPAPEKEPKPIAPAESVTGKDLRPPPPMADATVLPPPVPPKSPAQDPSSPAPEKEPKPIVPTESVTGENLRPPPPPTAEATVLPSPVPPKYLPLVHKGGKPAIKAHVVRVDVALQILAPGKTVEAVRIDNVGGVSAAWRSDGKDSAAPLTVMDGGVLPADGTAAVPVEDKEAMPLADGTASMSLVLGTAEKLLLLRFTDNGAVAGRETDLRVTVFFTDKTRAMCLLSKWQESRQTF